MEHFIWEMKVPDYVIKNMWAEGALIWIWEKCNEVCNRLQDENELLTKSCTTNPFSAIFSIAHY